MISKADKVKRAKKHFNVGSADMLHGEKRIIDIDGKRIGIFNVHGEYYALHDRCPHMAGSLCGGPVTGTALESSHGEFVYGKEGELIRCGWHGWEFEIATGQCLVDQRTRAKTYAVTVEEDALVLHI